MKANCPKSCNACPETKETKTKTATAQPTGVQEALLEQSAAYGTKQTAEGSQRSDTIQRIQESLQYMKTDQVTTLPKKIKEGCQVSRVILKRRQHGFFNHYVVALTNWRSHSLNAESVCGVVLRLFL